MANVHQYQLMYWTFASKVLWLKWILPWSTIILDSIFFQAIYFNWIDQPPQIIFFSQSRLYDQSAGNSSHISTSSRFDWCTYWTSYDRCIRIQWPFEAWYCLKNNSTKSNHFSFFYSENYIYMYWLFPKFGTENLWIEC